VSEQNENIETSPGPAHTEQVEENAEPQVEPDSKASGAAAEEIGLLDGLAGMISDDSTSASGSAKDFEVRPAGEAFNPEEEPQMNTQTMAELLMKQGQIEKALEIYKDISRREPMNQEVLGRIEEINSRLAAAPAGAQGVTGKVEEKAKENIEKLDTWLNKLKTR